MVQAQPKKSSADTAVYTFKLQLDEPDLKFSPCGHHRPYFQTYKYKVLGSTYPAHLVYVVMHHSCPDEVLFKNGRVYEAKGQIDTTNMHMEYGVFSLGMKIPLLVAPYFRPSYKYIKLKF